MKERIKYLDVAKFIGIFCIFLGHFASASGYAYKFVFIFHVPLFFFLSGCAENISTDIPFWKYIKKNIKMILIPCYIFAITSVVLNCIYTNTHINIGPYLIQIIKGCIRNHFFAGSLWFLTCLFVVKIMFYIFKKILKYKPLILIACFTLYLIAQLVIEPKPIATPHMLYNVDSACYYIVFYALGYCCFKTVNSILSLDNIVKKMICNVIGIGSFIYSATLFFEKHIFSLGSNSTIVYLVNSIFSPFVIILFVLIISKILDDVPFLVEMGKDTLFLCGSEYIIKLLVPICLEIIGLNMLLTNPIATYLYTFALLILCYKILVPIEKKVFKKLHLL